MLCAAAIAAFAAGSITAASAQQAANKPAPVVKATHGDWQVQCDKARVPVGPEKTNAESGKGNKADSSQLEFKEIEQCGIVQLSVDKQNKNIGVKVAVFKAKDKEIAQMQVVAPLGVYLPNGLAIEIDGKPLGRFPFISCPAVGCLTVVPINEAGVTAMKKGTAANIIIYRNQAQGIGLQLSLKGFTAAFGDL